MLMILFHVCAVHEWMHIGAPLKDTVQRGSGQEKKSPQFSNSS